MDVDVAFHNFNLDLFSNVKLTKDQRDYKGTRSERLSFYRDVHNNSNKVVSVAQLELGIPIGKFPARNVKEENKYNIRNLSDMICALLKGYLWLNNGGQRLGHLYYYRNSMLYAFVNKKNVEASLKFINKILNTFHMPQISERKLMVIVNPFGNYFIFHKRNYKQLLKTTVERKCLKNVISNLPHAYNKKVSNCVKRLMKDIKSFSYRYSPEGKEMYHIDLGKVTVATEIVHEDYKNWHIRFNHENTYQKHLKKYQAVNSSLVKPLKMPNNHDGDQMLHYASLYHSYFYSPVPQGDKSFKYMNYSRNQRVMSLAMSGHAFGMCLGHHLPAIIKRSSKSFLNNCDRLGFDLMLALSHYPMSNLGKLNKHQREHIYNVFTENGYFKTSFLKLLIHVCDDLNNNFQNLFWFNKKHFYPSTIMFQIVTFICCLIRHYNNKYEYKATLLICRIEYVFSQTLWSEQGADSVANAYACGSEDYLDDYPRNISYFIASIMNSLSVERIKKKKLNKYLDNHSTKSLNDFKKAVTEYGIYAKTIDIAYKNIVNPGFCKTHQCQIDHIMAADRMFSSVKDQPFNKSLSNSLGNLYPISKQLNEKKGNDTLGEYVQKYNCTDKYKSLFKESHYAITINGHSSIHQQDLIMQLDLDRGDYKHFNMVTYKRAKYMVTVVVEHLFAPLIKLIKNHHKQYNINNKSLSKSKLHINRVTSSDRKFLKNARKALHAFHLN